MSGRLPSGPTVMALLRRPRLWPAAARLVPPRWWRRWPPLPMPPADYVRFRNETMYGAGGALDGEDLVRYLDWSRLQLSDAISSRSARSQRR